MFSPPAKRQASAGERAKKIHGEQIHALRDAQDQLCPLIHIFQLACY